MEMAQSMGVGCHGELLPAGGGTYIGHVVPGAFFLAWGLHWMQAIFRQHIKSQSSGEAFSAKPWFTLADYFGLNSASWVPAFICTILYGFEPFLKMLAGPIGLSMELYFDDKDGLRPMFCQESGQFAMKYAHNWQHASMYPAFVLSGLVDYICMRVRLPPGTQHVFLGSAFLSEGMLMLVHKKHLPLDAVLHNCLALTMLATAAGVFAELRAPENFLVSAFKSFSLTMHGLWMILMGKMLFTGSKAWTDEYAGPAMLAPPFFAMVCLLVLFGYFMSYIAIEAFYHCCRPATPLPVTSPKAAQPADYRRLSSSSSVDDSALESSDDGLEPSDSVSSDTKGIRKQLNSVANKLKIPNTFHHKHSKSSEHII